MKTKRYKDKGQNTLSLCRLRAVQMNTVLFTMRRDIFQYSHYILQYTLKEWQCECAALSDYAWEDPAFSSKGCQLLSDGIKLIYFNSFPTKKKLQN